MRAAARDLEPRDHWDRLALQRVADDLPRQQSELSVAAIRHAKAARTPPAASRDAAHALVEAWTAPRRDLADRLIQPMASFDRQGVWSLAKLVLLGDAVREFVYASRVETATAKR
jgi:glutamate dehydrogenase